MNAEFAKHAENRNEIHFGDWAAVGTPTEGHRDASRRSPNWMVLT